MPLRDAWQWLAAWYRMRRKRCWGSHHVEIEEVKKKLDEALDERVVAARQYANAAEKLHTELRRHPIDDLIETLGRRDDRRRHHPDGTR